MILWLAEHVFDVEYMMLFVYDRRKEEYWILKLHYEDPYDYV